MGLFQNPPTAASDMKSTTSTCTRPVATWNSIGVFANRVGIPPLTSRCRQPVDSSRSSTEVR